MRKSKLPILFITLVLFGCENPPQFEAASLAKTWHCHTNDHVYSFNSTTTYNLDGSFIGTGDLRVDLSKNSEPALLQMSVEGTWSISGNQFTTNINKNIIGAKNSAGTLILEEAKKLASEMQVYHSKIISVEPSKVTFKEGNSYFKKTCLLKSISD